MKGMEIVVQAATSILALLLATTLFFTARLLQGSIFYKSLRIFLIGTVLIIVRPSYMIIASLLGLNLPISYLDFISVAVFTYGALYIKGLIQKALVSISDTCLIEYLNLEKDLTKRQGS